MATQTVTLRKYPISKGRESLYLDYYPAIRDKESRKMIQKEVLGIYVFKDPKDEFEKEHNKNMMDMAKLIHAQRLQSVLNQTYGFFDKHRLDESFMEYFARKAQPKGPKWQSTFKHFHNFVKGKCKFRDLDLELCTDFREYLLKEARQLDHTNYRLSNNSASGYFSTFRAMLKITYREKRIHENINEYLDSIKWEDSPREFLTLDEVQMLIDTPCVYPVLKHASMFSIMTGLRISDILQLQWSNITHLPTEGWCIRLKTQKTRTEAILPISEETLGWCGPRGEGLVFKGLERHMTNYPLKRWVEKAGISKHITFHLARHTFASLHISYGTDIYTVSKMLTHRNVSTTEIYAKLLNEKKVESAHRISFINNKPTKNE